MQSDLSSLKRKLDKLDIDKLETTPVDLSKLSNVVKTDVVKKAEYDELVKNVNAIQTLYTRDLVELTATQKLTKSKIKLLILIMVNILLLKNFVS